MEIRLAVRSDLDRICAIIAGARAHLREQGSAQWQGGHGPSTETLAADIRRGAGYVLLDGGDVCGYGAIPPGSAADGYATITGGDWEPGTGGYRAVHRVAIDRHHRGMGLAQPFLQRLTAAAAELGCTDIRIDTHRKNLAMQRTILRAGFSYRGVITLPIPDGERLAYQFLPDSPSS